MEYKLEKINGSYYVINLKNHLSERKDVLLLVYSKQGDVDTVSENDRNMHEALYDLYQISEYLKDGDVFTIDGNVIYHCEGLHVVKVD